MTAVGESYERVGCPGSLYMVVRIERRYAVAYQGPAYYITLLCVVPPDGSVFDHPGRRFNEVVNPLELQRYGYTRVG